MYLNFSILINGLGEAAVHGWEVGAGGITCDAILRDGRPQISDHI